MVFKQWNKSASFHSFQNRLTLCQDCVESFESSVALSCASRCCKRTFCHVSKRVAIVTTNESMWLNLPLFPFFVQQSFFVYSTNSGMIVRASQSNCPMLAMFCRRRCWVPALTAWANWLLLTNHASKQSWIDVHRLAAICCNRSQALQRFKWMWRR